MIIGQDFVWLHFPKCGGTSVRTALGTLLSDRPDVVFDPIDPGAVIWHQSIPQREADSPDFKLGDRKVFCCIRRLPYWILSRVLFEAERSSRIASREMIVSGKFFGSAGHLNSADAVVVKYTTPSVHRWIRTENLTDDLANAFGFEPERVRSALVHRNKAKIDYIKDLKFWFTPSEISQLYEANPVWAKTEKAVYGSLLTETGSELPSRWSLKRIRPWRL